MKKCWCRQNWWSVSRDLYIFVVFFRSGKTVLSFIIFGYVQHILGRGPFYPPSICELPIKGPSWGELKRSAYLVQINCNFFYCIKLINRSWRQLQTQMYLRAVLTTHLCWLNVYFWLFLQTLILFEQLLGQKFSVLLMKNPQCSSGVGFAPPIFLITLLLCSWTWLMPILLSWLPVFENGIFPFSVSA